MKKKKILNLFIGSNNQGKIKEIRDLLPKTTQILTPKNFNLKSPKETGSTFEENSFLKAKFFSKKTKMICLADDSGLEIDSLNKLRGMFSFAIYDISKKKLLLARDPFGIKPLYYYKSDKGIIF